MLLARWNRFWFAPQSPALLGFCRLVVCFFAFLHYRDSDLEAWGFFRPFFWQPIPLFQHLHLHPFSPMVMLGLGWIWKASILLGALGIFTRLNCSLAFVLGVYLVGLTDNAGKLEHADPIVLWSFLVFAIARSGDAWSIDCLLQSASGKPEPLQGQSSPVTQPRLVLEHAEYRWPVRMMQLLLMMIFCLSAISKLRQSGLAWAWSNNFRNTLIAQHYMTHSTLGWGLAIAAHPLLCRCMALGALGAELTAPLALLGGVFAAVLIPTLIAMQIGNEVLLGVAFHQFVICYAYWIPWTPIAAFTRRTLIRADGPKTAVLFDGSCGLCKRTMAVIRRLDLLDKVEILDVTHHWSAVAARYPELDQGQCLSTMHVVSSEGKITTGFFAYRTLCKVIPMGWLILPLLYISGVPIAGEAIYQRIADNRFRTGCAVGATAD